MKATSPTVGTTSPLPACAHGAGMELSARRKDGTEFPIEIRLSHVHTPEGPLAFGMVSDISERRRTEAVLLASENKLRSFAEAASEAIPGVSASGRFLLVNRRAEEMFGYSRGELLGLELEVLVPDRFRAAHAVRSADFSRPRVRHMGTTWTIAGRILAKRRDLTRLVEQAGSLRPIGNRHFQ